jgi:hypothetical protein
MRLSTSYLHCFFLDTKIKLHPQVSSAKWSRLVTMLFIETNYLLSSGQNGRGILYVTFISPFVTIE